jgi:uncharacterized membrane protein affecting hemolysin expression
MITLYEQQLLKLSKEIKERVNRMSKRYRILEASVYEDLDVLLSDSSEHFAKKGLENGLDDKEGEKNGNI